jgi:23S rRNA pseudouridine1911/1915/1917 synthase
MPIQPDRTGAISLLEEVSGKTGQELFPVHRLDRPVSGLVVFGRDKQAAAALSRQFAAGEVEKRYLAIVSPAPDPAAGKLVHALIHDRKRRRARLAEASDKKAREAGLEYKTLGKSDRYTLLEVQLQGGRFHQIRAQLAAAGYPIKGDVKYGARRRNHDRSIHLHAWKLRLQSPATGQWLFFCAPLPQGDPLWQFFSLLQDD